MTRHKLTLSLIYKLHQEAMSTAEISAHFKISLRLAQMMIKDLREDQIIVKVGKKYTLDHESGFIWLFRESQEQEEKPCEGCPGL